MRAGGRMIFAAVCAKVRFGEGRGPYMLTPTKAGAQLRCRKMGPGVRRGHISLDRFGSLQVIRPTWRLSSYL